MRLDMDRVVQVAIRPAVAAHVTLSWNTNPRVVRQPWRNVDRERLALNAYLLPSTRGTQRLTLPPRPAAVRARLREHHVPARGFHGAASVAMSAARLRRVEPTRAAARRAVFLARHRDLALPAAHRLVEGQRDRMMEVRAALRFRPRAVAFALLQNVGEQIPERRRRGAADADREVE